MGASSSKYPFPVPGYDSTLPPKPPKWSLSMKKKSSKGKDRDKYADFIVPKYPTPTLPANYYGVPYYPQTFPAYYAPVQMAVVQPFGMQQPVLTMPQAYLPMAAYQTTAAPVQPAVAPAPAVQTAPAIQMPVPAAAPAVAPAPSVQPVRAVQMPVPSAAPAPTPAQMPVPAPAPAPSIVPPQLAPSQMPQFYPFRDGPVIPSPIPAEPVIPPPPPDSARSRGRFTDFYRPADLPSLRHPAADDPVRPPTAGPSGSARTPHMHMPTPALASNNPLPPPPADVWGRSPYRRVLENLPNDVSNLLDLENRSEMLVPFPEPDAGRSLLGGLFGTTRDKGKKPLKGLFRSRSTSGHDVLGDVGSSSRHGHTRAQTMATIVIPPGGRTSSIDMPEPGPSMPTAPNSMPTPGSMPVPSSMPVPGSMPVPTQDPPIRFDHTGEHAGFVNHSPHRVMYKNKMYPTALHLLEAMKFVHEPRLQERIRTCKDVNDMYPLSASFQEHVRSDWGQVFLQAMEDVLYLKFKQHPGLRTLLLRTGLADIIYADENTYWGEGPSGEGTNELGKALARIRERLRQEGER